MPKNCAEIGGKFFFGKILNFDQFYAEFNFFNNLKKLQNNLN